MLIFFLTCITEVFQLLFWIAAFVLAVIWPFAWMIIKAGGPTYGFSALFACVASLVVPLFTAVVFSTALIVLKKKTAA